MSHHHHHHRRSSQSSLLWTLLLTGGFMFVEFAGGWLSGSLALLSDAGHMLTDVLALGLSLLAIRFAATPATPRKTYGFYRLEILAALANGVTLLVLSGYIFYEAAQRFRSPADIRTGLMIGVAAAGLLVNLAGFFILRRSSKENLNVRGAYLHVLGDLLSSVAVVIGGTVIGLTGWNVIDPLLGVLIGLVILKGAYDLVRESVDVLLEAAPVGLESRRVQVVMEEIPGVREVHHLHLWSISSGIHALSAHVLIDDQMVSQSDRIIHQLREALQEKAGIAHATIQVECTRCGHDTCVIELCHDHGEDGHDH